MLDWIINIVPWWVWLIGGVALARFAYLYLGWKGALGVGATLLAVFGYGKGRKDSNASHEKRADNIERRRQDAYDKIDDRGTTRDDAVDRLRKGDY